ncbi:MAG: hypothetical protein N838_28895 [Thiohalocapsa sp. PB-PSB1]|jgi:hypothetical protein|nr:MAG: hypothetical protein N838_28895 [Thiohalocapsa sp. PB-PSB1]
MKRRAFIQTVPLTAMLPAGLAIASGTAHAEQAAAGQAAAGMAAPGTAPATGGGGAEAPDFAKDILTSPIFRLKIDRFSPLARVIARFLAPDFFHFVAMQMQLFCT